jgi:hypothetical protein
MSHPEYKVIPHTSLVRVVERDDEREYRDGRAAVAVFLNLPVGERLFIDADNLDDRYSIDEVRHAAVRAGMRIEETCEQLESGRVRYSVAVISKPYTLVYFDGYQAGNALTELREGQVFLFNYHHLAGLDVLLSFARWAGIGLDFTVLRKDAQGTYPPKGSVSSEGMEPAVGPPPFRPEEIPGKYPPLAVTIVSKPTAEQRRRCLLPWQRGVREQVTRWVFSGMGS